MKTTITNGAMLVGLCTFTGVPAHAASDEDLAAIRQQLDALHKEYDAKIHVLEERLKLAEEEARAARVAAQE